MISVEGRCKKILQEELTCKGADVENFVHGTLERHKTEIMESCLSEGITEVAEVIARYYYINCCID